MLDWLVPISIATLLGFLAGMGVGGGSLLLLWLTQVVVLPQSQARILNLRSSQHYFAESHKNLT